MWSLVIREAKSTPICIHLIMWPEQYNWRYYDIFLQDVGHIVHSDSFKYIIVHADSILVCGKNQTNESVLPIEMWYDFQ